MDKVNLARTVATEAKELTRQLQWTLWEHEELLKQRQKMSNELATGLRKAAQVLKVLNKNRTKHRPSGTGDFEKEEVTSV
jgi:hypothetical protein